MESEPFGRWIGDSVEIVRSELGPRGSRYTALATLFLTIGGIRYLLAGGDPAALERAKGSIKAAIIGYALALLAPVLATVVQHVVGG